MSRHREGRQGAAFTWSGFVVVFCFWATTTWSPKKACAQCEPIGWKAMGSGAAGGDPNFGPAVQGFALFDDGAGEALYVAGNFTSMDGTPANYIARWNGREWSSLGAGLDDRALCLQVYDDGSGPALYVGGEFLNAGGQPAKGIAKWDGKTWSPLGAGISGGPARCLTVFDPGGGPWLYVGGSFTSAGGVSATSGLAKWNGQSWLPGPGSVATNDFAVMDLGSGPTLYAATTLGVRKLVNTSWTVIGATSTGHPVNAIEPYTPPGGTLGLYAGGQFTTIGGAAAKNFAVWNGAAWTQVGAGTQGVIDVLYAASESGGPVLYMGGKVYKFPSLAGDAYIQGVGAWNGTTILPFGIGMGPGDSALGPGVPFDPVEALFRWDDGHGEALWAGGSFPLAGGNPANGLAKWSPMIDEPNLNHNLWQDACEIQAGLGFDCNKDGIPDDCQGGAEYRLDEGFSFQSWGNNGDIMWLNQFTVLSGAEVVTCVMLPWSYLAHEGTPITVALYSDPNGDGDPADAVLLASADAVNLCQTGLPMEFGYVPIVPTFVGPAGTSFFVGAKAELGGDSYPDYMAVSDSTEPIQHRSWEVYGSAGTVDIHDLLSGAVPPIQVNFNWVLRALSQDCNGNLALDSCDMALGVSADVNGDGLPDECAQVPCLADLAPVVGDGVVNVDDLFAAINAWGACSGCPADIDGSGQVDIDDLFAVINAWGPCP